MVGCGCDPQKLLGKFRRNCSQAASDGTDRVPAGHEAKLLASIEGVSHAPGDGDGDACGDGEADAHGLLMQIGYALDIAVPVTLGLNSTMPLVV